MNSKHIISMVISALFVVSACGEDDSTSKKPENPPSATDLCKDKSVGDKCAEGKTCQKDGDKLVCKAADTSQDDLCKDKSAGEECAEGKTCQKDGDKLECKPRPGGNLDDEKEWACGTEVCRGSQYCDLKTKKCIDRVEKAVAGKPCDKSTFVENCDGNKVVYCDGKTVVYDCNDTIDENTQKPSVCAMKRNENYAGCVSDNNRCNAEIVGRTRLCFDTESGVPPLGYWEYFDCERATDGKYYMFRTEEDSKDCVGGCINDMLCATTDDPCDSATYKSHCDGNLLKVCGEGGKVFITDCMGDYKVACIEDAESGAMCDYKNMPLE